MRKADELTPIMEKPEKPEWQVLESEYLFRRPWCTVRRETLRLPNGNCIPEYYVFEYPAWVNTIGITTDGKFVMVRQYRRALDATSFELCAGVCENEDASPLISARRELLEETGYGNGTWTEFLVSSANPATHNNLVYSYLATNVELVSTQNLEATEDMTVHLLTLDEVKTLLLNGEIKQALHAAPLWKYMAVNRLL